MKKIVSVFLCTVMLISFMRPLATRADETDAVTPTYSNYDIIKEVAFAYMRQGAQIPYDKVIGRRSLYSSPEEATAQRTIFLDCSSFANSCYREAFGVNVQPYELRQRGASTSNFDSYAKDNQGADDVVGYWVATDYTTTAARQEVVDWIYANLEIGDVLTYRHGKTTATAGHVYMYIGDKTFIHCGGAGSYITNESNPALSYDDRAGENTIGTLSASVIFEDTSHTRYIFKKTSSDTVMSFSIIRPLARNLTPTEKTLNRMKIAGLSMEKTASVFENASVDTGDILTYTITLENTNSSALSGITITDVLPKGTEFVSGDEGVTVSEDRISWTGDVGAKKKSAVKYSVRIIADTPGFLIISDNTYVSGIKLGKITHSLSGYNNTQRALVTDEAKSYANTSKTFEDGFSMVKAVYQSALGVDVFGDCATPELALDQLIDRANLSKHTATELSKMIAPNLYGGQDIYAGWVWYPTENYRTRLPKEENLSVGDIILADWSTEKKPAGKTNTYSTSGNSVYLYVGNSTLITVENGVAKPITIGSNIYKAGDNILISLLGYARYAILRPSMVSLGEETDVMSLEITAPPSKLVYQSGEYFDATGMVVKVTLSDGTQKEISGYSISPSTLAEGTNAVTISFGDLTANVPVTVLKNEYITSVSEATTLATGKTAKVEGIVVGVAHEGKNNDTELIIKDLSNDNLMAVRDIPYGTFPDFGYKKGDRILFEATVKKDTSTSTCYNLKKYLSFSSDNGTIDTTIISKGNTVNFKFDNVVVINSQEDMKKVFAGNGPAMYTYLKFTEGAYFNCYQASDTNLYRIHKNPQATGSGGITVSNNYNTAVPVAVRGDVMEANIGADWADLFFDETLSSYPGSYIEKAFYAVYTGGNRANIQLAVLDESWVIDNKFEFLKISEDKKSVEISVKVPGTYTVIFVDYKDKAVANIDIVPIIITENQTGINTVNMLKDFELGTGDKVLLWDNTNSMSPKCKALEIE